MIIWYYVKFMIIWDQLYTFFFIYISNQYAYINMYFISNFSFQHNKPWQLKFEDKWMIFTILVPVRYTSPGFSLKFAWTGTKVRKSSEFSDRGRSILIAESPSYTSFSILKLEFSVALEHWSSQPQVLYRLSVYSKTKTSWHLWAEHEPSFTMPNFHIRAVFFVMDSIILNVNKLNLSHSILY